MAVPEGGSWAVCYVANESALDVFFDAVKVSREGIRTQENHYYPFGLNIAALRKDGRPDDKFQYNGKELQEEHGLLWNDYGARFYDPALGRWHCVDPLAEKYLPLSPYNYVANNPVRLIDPNGKEIEEGSQEEWGRQKQKVQNRRDNLQRKIDKLHEKAEEEGWSTEKLAKEVGSLTERVAGLNGTLSTMSVLESSEQVYVLDPGAAENLLSYDTSTGNLVISYSGTALFAHETTHAGQFETGDVAFHSETGSSIAQDVYDEVAAYKAQWAYDPETVGLINSSSQITPSWVQGITMSNGEQPYKPGGSANLGVAPVNVNSNRDALIRAYPHAIESFQSLPANVPLKDLSPNIYYKR